ncbi:MAG: hypothetical protein LBQ75_01660, partial [Zoogloeaceae bacterium]|nr:hypothetical protein [Zoogloeaceae bacterium]
EYCVGAIMLLAYAGLTICFFSFLWPPPFIQTLMQTLDGIWGIVVRIVWIAGTLAYILFAILFLLHFGKLHGRVCAAVKSCVSGWFKK